MDSAGCARLCRGSLGTIRTNSPGLTLCFLLFLPCPPQLLLAAFSAVPSPVPQGRRPQQVPVAAWRGSVRQGASACGPERAPSFPCTHPSVVRLGSPGASIHTTRGEPFFSTRGGAQNGGAGAPERVQPAIRAQRGVHTSLPHACPARVLSTPKLRGEMAHILVPLCDLLATRVSSPRAGSRRKRLVRWPLRCCALRGRGGSQSASLPAAGSAPSCLEDTDCGWLAALFLS